MINTNCIQRPSSRTKYESENEIDNWNSAYTENVIESVYGAEGGKAMNERINIDGAKGIEEGWKATDNGNDVEIGIRNESVNVANEKENRKIWQSENAEK